MLEFMEMIVDVQRRMAYSKNTSAKDFAYFLADEVMHRFPTNDPVQLTIANQLLTSIDNLRRV